MRRAREMVERRDAVENMLDIRLGWGLPKSEERNEGSVRRRTKNATERNEKTKGRSDRARKTKGKGQ